MFGNLTTEGLEESQDRLGGFRVLESGPYTGKIKVAYAGKSPSSSAQSITVILDTQNAGEYRETFWVTNGKGQNYFHPKDGKGQPDTSKRNPLPGFTIVDDICLVTTNKPLSEQPTEEKVLNIYDPEAKKEVPKGVPVLVELIGKEVTFGILKETRNKQVKNAAGEYEDTAESRDENVTDKIFHYPSNITVAEARKGIQQAAFYGSWVEKNKGQTRDRRSIKDGATGAAGRSGRPSGPPPSAGGQAAAATKSLFG